MLIRTDTVANVVIRCRIFNDLESFGALMLLHVLHGVPADVYLAPPVVKCLSAGTVVEGSDSLDIPDLLYFDKEKHQYLQVRHALVTL